MDAFRPWLLAAAAAGMVAGTLRLGPVLALVGALIAVGIALTLSPWIERRIRSRTGRITVIVVTLLVFAAFSLSIAFALSAR